MYMCLYADNKGQKPSKREFDRWKSEHTYTLRNEHFGIWTFCRWTNKNEQEIDNGKNEHKKNYSYSNSGNRNKAK